MIEVVIIIVIERSVGTVGMKTISGCIIPQHAITGGASIINILILQYVILIRDRKTFATNQF